MDFSTLLAGPLGGILGLAGAIFQKWVAMKEARQNHEFKMEELKLASQIDLQKADIAFRQTIEEKNAESFTEAIRAQAALKPTGVVLGVLSLFRPGLTLALWISSTAMAIYYRDALPELMNFIITSTFGMFSIAVGYWFGVRTEEKFRINKAAP